MPGLRFYEVLNLRPSAADQDVRKAYRRLALKYHPDKNPQNKEQAEKKFREIAEAYEVLSDKTKRRDYDRLGEHGLRSSSCNFNGSDVNNEKPGYYAGFHFRSPFDVFREFFGDRDPFESLFKQDDEIFGPHFCDKSQYYHLPGRNAENRRPSYGRFMPTNFIFNVASFDDDCSTNSNNGCFFSTTSFSSSADKSKPATVRKTCTSTKFVDGKCVVTRKQLDNTIETVEVLEDGKLLSKTVSNFSKAVGSS